MRAMHDDTDLLREFVEFHSEAAFSTLVQRYVNLVYSTALRASHGDSHRAEEACNLVFTDLARKAPSLLGRSVLGGWLYLSTSFAVARLTRDERRWRLREQEAHKMNDLNAGASAEDVEWNQVRPVIDDALREMDDEDREAVIMRFFEGQTFSRIGARLGLSEDTARKRVERSLDKLHALLTRRGISSTAAALATVLVTNVVTAAPAGLAVSATSAALAATSGFSGSILVFMSSIKLKLAIGTALVLAAGVGLTLQTRANRELRHELRATREHDEATQRALTAAERRSEATLAKAATLETQLAAAQAKLNDAAHAAASKSNAAPANEQPRGPAPVVLSRAEWNGLMKAHPELLEAQNIEAKYNMERCYGALFKNLNLTSDKIAQFEELLLDKTHAPLDVYAAAEAQGIDPEKNKEEYNRLVGTAQNETEAKIKNLLGDSGYAQLQTYDQTLAQRGAVMELQLNLASSSKPLTAQQVESLVTILAATAPDLGRTGIVPSEAYVQAQSLLAPEQIGALQLMRQKSEASQTFTETLKKLYGSNVRGMSVR